MVVGLCLIGAAVTSAVLGAASLRLSSLVSTLLAAYLGFVGELGLVTWALSPLRGVTRAGLAAAEAVLLAAALAVWWRRGRPGLPLAAAVPSARRLVSGPVSAICLGAVALLLAY